MSNLCTFSNLISTNRLTITKNNLKICKKTFCSLRDSYHWSYSNPHSHLSRILVDDPRIHSFWKVTDEVACGWLIGICFCSDCWSGSCFVGVFVSVGDRVCASSGRWRCKPTFPAVSACGPLRCQSTLSIQGLFTVPRPALDIIQIHF